jgi:hypothetical protein
MSDGGLTLADMQVMAKGDVFLRNFFRRLNATTYIEFLDVLYDDITIAVERLEQNPQHYPDEHEDATTQRLLDILFGMAYSASHNCLSGGNVDITIELAKKNWRWIGEAKRFNNTRDLREGYLQLSTRYTPSAGSTGAAHGGLIAYLRRPLASKCMDSWKKHFSEQVSPASKLNPCARRGQLGFLSEHEHGALGVPFKVWHFCVALYFHPLDKSGRAAKKYRRS